MKTKLNTLFLLLLLLIFLNPSIVAQDCDAPIAQTELNFNSVKAGLLQGGSLWWDGSHGKYIFPYHQDGPEVSALFAGGFWLGGIDPGGNLKLVASTYGLGNGNSSYFAGPLDENGQTNLSNCTNWDRFFTVYKGEIDAFKNDWQDNGVLDNPIPPSLRGWPAIGNPHFLEYSGFSLPDQQLAPFHDTNNDGIYNPSDGDYPATKDASQATWWVFNDSGNSPQKPLNSTPVTAEVQVMAYAYSGCNISLDNSTFYDVKLIHKAIEPLDSAYFSLWVDPDLGCHTDDFMGCIPEEKMAIIYNEDAVDGTTGCNCDLGVNSYCEEIPIIGIKVMEDFNEDGMGNGLSSFLIMGYNLPPTQAPPNTIQEYYNLMTGHWLDGSPILDPDGNEVQFQYPGNPADPEQWSLCTDEAPPADRRFLMNFGPFNLDPGQIKEMTFAVIGVENVAHPCPSITPLTDAVEEINEYLDDLTADEDIIVDNNIISFSPNPLTDVSFIKVKNEDLSITGIQVFNAKGTLVVSENSLYQKEYVLKKQNLAPGMYFYKINTTSNKIGTGKFIVQ